MMKGSDMSNGLILFEGPSELDGAPIVVVLTWHSQNEKTGHKCGKDGPRACKDGAECMVQTWILRQDMSPVDAIKSRDDVSICGDCVHRGDPATGKGRSCYVNPGQAPRSVWEAYRRGNYARVSSADAAVLIAQNERAVRFGAYGDPAAVPLSVWMPIKAAAKLWTGYTHQWRNLGAAWRFFLMASADSESGRAEARAAGWRSFEVTATGAELVPGAIECLSDSKGLKCIDCGACAGTKDRDRPAVDVFIRAHGSGAKHIDARALQGV